MTHNRLVPSDVDPQALEELSEMLATPGHVALIDDQGRRAELPAALFTFFARIVSLMTERRTLTLMPEDETFTTQAAANHLGVSRQHLVDLLETGEIPHHKVGSHRRVRFSDLIAYERVRDKARREALDRLAEQVEDADLYDASYTGTDEG